MADHLNLENQSTCLIVGGGMAGLIAATVLQRQGMTVTILDKGRGIGGRLATRRLRHSAGDGVFDYGAQVFTVSDSRFQSWVETWLQQGVITEWSVPAGDTGKPGYRGAQSNRSLAQHLAQELTVHTQTRVTTITWQAPHWIVQTDQGESFQGDRLLLTAPVPQSLALLETAAIAIPPAIHQQLAQVTYQPCIAVLALLEKSSLLPDTGGLWLDHPDLSWMACNQKKGISPQAAAVTLHATPTFSQRYWEAEEDAIAKKLFQIAAPWLGSAIVEYQVHRWRYSQPQTCYGETYLALSDPGPLVLAGDAFATHIGAPSLNLEKAALSGLDAASYLLGA